MQIERHKVSRIHEENREVEPLKLLKIVKHFNSNLHGFRDPQIYEFQERGVGERLLYNITIEHNITFNMVKLGRDKIIFFYSPVYINPVKECLLQ